MPYGTEATRRALRPIAGICQPLTQSDPRPRCRGRQGLAAECDKAQKVYGEACGCIEQVDGLYNDSLYGASPRLDEEGRLRADDKELDEPVQTRVKELWPQVSTDNLHELSDFAGYKIDFPRLFCFGFEQVNYDEDVSPEVPIPYLCGAIGDRVHTPK